VIEELKAQCQSLQEKVTQLELYAASRDQLIKDIEVKFTDHLRTQNRNVYDELNTLNQRLMYSTNEVAEYQAELMIASREDEGATLRIEELERRGALMENGARRIHHPGMEIQEEYKDEVHHLRGLLGNTESRLEQLQHNNNLTTNVAEKLFQEGKEMQIGFENSIVTELNWHRTLKLI
jgi:chromosome segregation ATPase